MRNCGWFGVVFAAALWVSSAAPAKGEEFVTVANKGNGVVEVSVRGTGEDPDGKQFKIDAGKEVTTQLRGTDPFEIAILEANGTVTVLQKLSLITWIKVGDGAGKKLRVPAVSGRVEGGVFIENKELRRELDVIVQKSSVTIVYLPPIGKPNPSPIPPEPKPKPKPDPPPENPKPKPKK
jgi:hypothetical protein